jgi:hypothetical protein
MDVAAAGQAIVDGRFADVSGACTVAPIVDEVFPLSVVRWDIESASRSRICLDRTLLTSDRLPFFAQRLAGALPIIEAAHTHGKLSPNSVLLNLDDMPLRRGLAFCSDNESDLLIPDSVFVREKGISAYATIGRKASCRGLGGFPSCSGVVARVAECRRTATGVSYQGS